MNRIEWVLCREYCERHYKRKGLDCPKSVPNRLWMQARFMHGLDYRFRFNEDEKNEQR